MAQISGDGHPGKLIFMDGFDGANKQAGVPEGLWFIYRNWHSSSFDSDSPSAQSPIDDSNEPQVIGFSTGHIPGNPAGGNWPADSWYFDKDACVRFRAPHNGGASNQPGLLWRTGSGNDGDISSGFPDIVQAGGTVFLGFAFNFRSQDITANTGSDGCLKIWMGCADYNGSGSGAGMAGKGGYKYLGDPGVPTRSDYNGRNGASHHFQEERVCLEIYSGSTNNIHMYKSALATDSNPVGTAWTAQGSTEIVADRWYWGVWEIKPGNALDGRSAFYMGNSSIPTLLVDSENTRDGNNFSPSNSNRVLSSLGMALRGPGNQGVGDTDFEGSYESPDSNNNQVDIDDIVMFYNMKPAETFCVILSASAIDSAGSFISHNAPDLISSVSESSQLAMARLPITSSWAETTVPHDNLQVQYADFPWTTSPVQIYGVGALSLCSSDNSNFTGCTQSFASDANPGVYDTNIRESIIPQPGSGPVAIGHDNPFVFIREAIWPTSSVGTDWSVSDIDSLTGKTELG